MASLSDNLMLTLNARENGSPATIVRDIKSTCNAK